MAEAMKVLGFVNRFSRGVQRVQEELRLNGNGEADFNLELISAFLVKVNVSERSTIHDTKEDTKDDTKEKGDAESFDLKKVTCVVYYAIVASPTDTKAQLMAKLGLSSSTISRAISELKQYGINRRVSGRKAGAWEILKDIS